MYIIERVNKIYCYIYYWQNGEEESKCIGKLEDGKGPFIPNKLLRQIISATAENSASEHEKKILETVTNKYGNDLLKAADFATDSTTGKVIATATPIFYGTDLVLGGITRRYKLDNLLAKSFNDKTSKDILSLAWFVALEGSALSNNDSWLDYYENPRGCGISSQDVTRLLDTIHLDGIMTFFKLWLKHVTGGTGKKENSEKVLYDLTSISYYGKGIAAAEWGYNRDHDELPQVNFALLCIRSTAMPLFAWVLNGSITDSKTLQTTLQYLQKLEYKPDCLMMDRAFALRDNITYMLKNGYTFLQTMLVNSGWVYELIDFGERDRLRPDSMVQIEDSVYYCSTNQFLWVVYKDRENTEKVLTVACHGKRNQKYTSTDPHISVVSQHQCTLHVAFCNDLVGNQYDNFMAALNKEYNRLKSDESAKVQSKFKKYFKIERKKYARHRSIEFDIDKIQEHRNKYVGYICFVTNDPTIKTAEDALLEYATRDVIEKDFDDMKNSLDMKRLRIRSDDRMRARLFIQFIAEIFLREIRVCLKGSAVCKKLSRNQVANHIKTIIRIKFKGKYRDVCPSLSKSQRAILEALNIKLS